MKTLNEQIQRLRDILHTCYESIASKGGTLPPVGERNMTNLPDAVESVPQVVGAELEKLTITANGEYTPQEGVDGFSKVVANVVPTKRVVIPTNMRVTNTQIIDGYWAGELVDTSLLTSIDSFFYYCNDLRICDVSNWDTSNVTNMNYVFSNCSKLEEIDVSNWDVSKVISCNSIFTRCEAVKELNISNWNLKSNNIYQMFSGCKALEMVDVSRLDVSNVTKLDSVFAGCASLKTIDVSKWDVSNVDSIIYTFNGCLSVSVIDVSNWDVNKVKMMESTFYSCSELKMLDLTNWDVSNVTYIGYAFSLCKKLSSLVGYRSVDEVITNNITALNGLKVSSNLSFNTTIIDRASLRAVINGLADLTGQTAQTLTLGATLIAKLTEEDIAIAVSKNWTIV